MADIFLSYASVDREAAHALRELLEAAGCTVWPGRMLSPGEDWESAREEALRDARCILVLWSAHLVNSSWLVEEAAAARRRSVSVIPVQLDSVKLPIGLRTSEAADLTDWDRSTPTASVQRLIANLQSLLARSGQTAVAAPSPSYSQQSSESYGEPAAPRPSAPRGVVTGVAEAVAGAFKSAMDLLRPSKYRAKRAAESAEAESTGGAGVSEPVLFGVAAARAAAPGSSFTARFAAYITPREPRLKSIWKSSVRRTIASSWISRRIGSRVGASARQ